MNACLNARSCQGDTVLNAYVRDHPDFELPKGEPSNGTSETTLSELRV